MKEQALFTPGRKSPMTRGLSERAAARRRERGLGNDVHLRTTRSYVQILRQNVFTFINVILFGVSLILILLAQYGDALVTAGLVLLNVLVGVFQEGRAKQTLEKIALLTRPRATVIRDGLEKRVEPGEIVLGDLLVARPGDQFVVDGPVVNDGLIEVDESLLTGESEPVLKRSGDLVYSGTFCLAGSALYRAQKVGGESLINQLTGRAQAYRRVRTPLQRDIDLLIRILVPLATQLGILLAISFILSGMSFVEMMRMAAVIVTLVPQGLLCMITVAYALGAVRVAAQGALIQQANAVESSSYVDLLCLDKTGTLTTNRLALREIKPVDATLEGDDASLRLILGDFAASTSSANRTTDAIRQFCGGQVHPLRAEVPFSSERRWSALAFADPARPGAYLLGAPEIFKPHLHGGSTFPQFDKWTDEGLRVLLFAHFRGSLQRSSPENEPQLPANLIPLALLIFCDELRLEARETLRHFSELGIDLKIISGDNPHAVNALARQLGMNGRLHVVSGLELEAMDDAELQTVALRATVFGRITPHQKERLVRLFGQMGHYVAMIGDGVNDLLSLKQAHLGIAMQSGSAATRGVADVVLLGDSFAALPVALREGQRIVRGMQDVTRLLLTRTAYVLLLIVATRLIGIPFPVTPKHNSILAMLTVGIPILAIATWARPGPPGRVTRCLSDFVFPAAVTISIVALTTYMGYLVTTGDLDLSRTALTTTSLLCGLLLIPFVEPPTAAWAGGDTLSGDWRPTLLALGMLALFALIMAVPSLRGFFEMAALRVHDYLIIGAVVLVWALALRFIWRAHLFQRFLGQEFNHELAS